jgi:hypothetical protein
MEEGNKNYYIYHHLGLGDHIICNAIVRNIYNKKSKNISLFCKPQNAPSVSYMYRDIDLQIIEADDQTAQKHLTTVPSNQRIIIGHQYLMPNIQGTTFDHAFYKQIGLNFERRWSDFYIERDESKEELFYKNLISSKKYIFLHDDPSRNLIIDRKHIINKDLQIVTPEPLLTKNIFEYAKVIENASEIHCIDSCFKLFTDSFLNKKDKQELFFHFNLHGGVIKDRTYSQSRLPWRFI